MDRILFQAVGCSFFNPCLGSSQDIIWGPFIKQFKSPGIIETLESNINAQDS